MRAVRGFVQGRRMTLSNVNGVRRINAQVVFQLTGGSSCGST